MKEKHTFFNKKRVFNAFFCIFLSILMILPIFIFAGCGKQSGVSGKADPNVNMTPRMITAKSTNLEEMIKSVTPAVVGISAIYSNVESVGSGVAIAPNGYIVTNNHVVEGAKDITIYFANKTSSKAKLIWSDKAMDLAIIKTEVNMPYLETASLDSIKVGADVIAIGTPLTLQFKHTTTKGIVSALNRTIEVDNEDGSTSYLQSLIQHDSSINPGNSGGPLINSNGQVIGINTLKVTDAEGLGFAIPVEIVLPVVNKILKSGGYETPYLGMFGFDATIAKFYNKTLETDGVYVLNIDSSAPIYEAGIRQGDIIVGVDDIGINTMLDLKKSIYNYEIGDNITISYLRNGIKTIKNITLSKRPN